MHQWRNRAVRILTRKRLLAVCAIAVAQSWLAVSILENALALGDAGARVPAWLRIAVPVLNLPGMLIAGPRLQAVIGDPAEIYLAAVTNGLLWGVTIVALAVWWRNRTRRAR